MCTSHNNTNRLHWVQISAEPQTLERIVYECTVDLINDKKKTRDMHKLKLRFKLVNFVFPFHSYHIYTKPVLNVT